MPKLSFFLAISRKTRFFSIFCRHNEVINGIRQVSTGGTIAWQETGRRRSRTNECGWRLFRLGQTQRQQVLTHVNIAPEATFPGSRSEIVAIQGTAGDGVGSVGRSVQ